MSSPSPVPVLQGKEGEDKDSLFSSEKSEEKATTTHATEEVDVVQEIEYSEEEINTLVSFVKDITTLYDLRPTDWTPECENVIKYWFKETNEPLLTIYFNADQLTCSSDVPTVPIVDLMYFIREPNHRFEVDKFYDTIIFGTIDDNIDGSLLNILQEVYAPMFFSLSNWPDSVKNEFSNNLHLFLAKITDLHYKLYALTVLYIPRDVYDIPLEDANRDRELIKRLEGLVVYWTKQIRVGLQDQDQNTPEDMLCLKDEYEFWKYRNENLLGLDHQLNNKMLRHICNILLSVQSTYVRQFRTLAEEITKSVDESFSNIEYLGLLVKPCEELEETQSPKDFPSKLPKILHLIRYIWLRSPYFNTVEKIITLCRSLSNQVILQCTDFIDLGIVFDNKETITAIKMFETCIDCMTGYIKTYVLVSNSHSTYGERPWDLDKAPIFNHVDSFIQRCKDMIEVCESMIVFGRYCETKRIPKPKFGGSRGLEFEQWAERTEKMFNDNLADIEKVRHRILDVQAAEWYDDILRFRTRMKDIEVVIENLANSVFDNVANVEEGIESLAAMHNYTHRKTLNSFFEKKTLLVYNMFKEEILDAKQDIQNESDVFPALMPYFAGRAHMINMKKNRLEILKKMFDEAGWMMPCSIAQEVFAQYDKLITSIDEKILLLYRKWVDSIGEDVNSRLNRPLLCKSVIKPGLLECNIDRSLLEIFCECKYWESLNYEIPSYVKNIYQKADSIKFVYQCVLNVVLNYNRILTSLSDDERLLFRPLIAAVEKKISPGLTKLTWGTDVGDEYIADCSNNTAELQAFVDDYKNCNLQIVLICEKICDTPLINIKSNYAFDVEELVNELASYMRNVIDQLVQYYQKIIQFLILVFEGFEQYMQSMANQWIKFINNFDTLMEEALKICCKNSLECVFEAVHGDGTTDPSPLLKLSANLINNRIIFKPTLVEVASVLSNILNSLVEALTALPRLNDKFHVAETNFLSYSEIVAADQNCQHMQKLLNQEVRVSVEKIKEYMKIWEPFRDLWEVDKDKFIVRYENENPSASLFDSNISRYTEMANNVQIQETIMAVHFLQINCADLKQGIIEHCMEWQQKLCNLLFKMTQVNLQELYRYIKINSEEVMKEPQNLSEMQTAIILFEQLMGDVPTREEEFPSMKDQIITLDKYLVPIPEELRNMEKNIPKEWASYLDLLSEAEKMLEYSKVLIEDAKK